jgi:hypothetical protein
MADPNQYLRMQLGGVSYLLPSTAGFTIEQRDNLIVNKSPDGNVEAWRVVRAERIPAYCLDKNLRVARKLPWQRAVFLDARPQAVGVVAQEVQLLARAETVIAPFTPLGPPPTRAGHLFAGAWVTGNGVLLVFHPAALASYLHGLGEVA